MQTAEFRYRAFISYSHSDERWASWLHKALERYRVPRRLVGRSTPAGAVPARIAPVFRDRDELPTATDLSRAVTAALDQSAAMIVICSPAAARSRWVAEEIRTFQRLGKQERIFCLIVSGAPQASGDDNCFPEALLTPAVGGGVVEPIGADVRPGKDSQRSALLKLLAGLLGVGLDELVRRDLQRRNRRLVAIAGAALVGMGLASVLAALAWFARNEAERQRLRAEVEAATAQQTSDFIIELFQVADPSEARGNTITAREILDRGAARIDRDLQDQPVVRANLMQTMGRVYTGLGLYAPATDLLRRALEQRQVLQREPTSEAVATANALGAALYLKGEYGAAEAVYTQALQSARALYDGDDPAISESLAGLGDLLTQRDDLTGAESHYRAALAIDRRLHTAAHPDVARTLAGLAINLLYQERFDESKAAFDEALEIRRAVLGADHPLVAETLTNSASMLYFAGQPDEAEPLFREAAAVYGRIFGGDHPSISGVLNNLGRLLLERGDLTEAEDQLTAALAMDRKLKDPEHDDFVYTLTNLALARLGAGREASAMQLLEEARTIADAHGHRMRGEVWLAIGEAHEAGGRAAEALDAIATARPLLAESQPNEPWLEAAMASIEGGAQLSIGDIDKAEPLLSGSFPVIAERWGEKSVFARLAARRMRKLYDLRGAPELARRYDAIAAPEPAR